MAALGRYELIRPLARGGMADVYLARRRVAGVEKRLVIKRLRRDRHRDPRFLDMFVREAQLSMSLVQQNIVPVFDFGRIGDDVFLAMEHIDGRDLGSTLARQRGSGMPAMLAAFVAAECCQALDHAHRRKDPVIHRDVTPRNVLLSWDGEVKLADFGIAAVAGGDGSGSGFGTPGYMAPEQANGAPVDARGDVYALGLVLWEALTGEHVRPTADRGAALAAARSGELPAIPSEVPAPLAAILARATAHDPALRYATARDLAEALDQFMVAERVRDAGGPPSKRLADWLTERWGDQRDEPDADALPAASGALITFLDDGAAGVRGEHTMRSIAETAAEEPDAADDESEVGAVVGLVEPAPRPLPDRAATATQIGTPPPSRLRWLATGVLLAALASAVVIIRMRDRTRAVAQPIALTADAAVAIDAAPAVDAALALDAPPLPLDAGVLARPDGAVLPPDAAVVRPLRIDAGVLAPKPSAVQRAIRINALPWAYFTVDGEARQYETPAQLELGVGSHRITFSNPQLGVSRTVTVTIPAEGDVRPHIEKMN